MNKQKIINLHPSLNFAEDLREICKPLQLLNIAYFAHVQIDKQGRFSALGLQPEFVKLYFDKEYYRYDIHMAKTSQNETYIIWDNLKRIKASKQLYEDFMDFKIGHTFTICQKHDGLSEYFHFSAKLGQQHMNQQYLLQIDKLKQFIYYFRDKINNHRNLKSAYQFKFSIPANDAGYLTTAGTNILQTPDFNQAVATNRIFLEPHSYLTQKELECLHYMASGKTRDEIAFLLNVTPRTIKAHIQNIKSKLNCRNQFQLGLKYSQIQFLNNKSYP